MNAVTTDLLLVVCFLMLLFGGIMAWIICSVVEQHGDRLGYRLARLERQLTAEDEEPEPPTPAEPNRSPATLTLTLYSADRL